MPRFLLAVSLAVVAAACGGGDATRPVAVSSVILNRTTLQMAVGDSILLSATLRDANGNLLTDRSVAWTSTNHSVATVSGAGWVKAVGAGDAKIFATSEAVSAEANVAVTSTPVLGAIAPALLMPGIPATITGSGFAADTSANIVLINGTRAKITTASPTQLGIIVPHRDSLSCRARHNATVSVTVGGISGSRLHPLEMTTPRTLGVGESIEFTTASAARCNEFSQTGGRYLVTVYRPDLALDSASFRFTGDAPAPVSPRIIPAVELPVMSRAATGGGVLAPFRMIVPTYREEVKRRHRVVLEENLRMTEVGREALRRARSGIGGLTLSRTRASFAVATVGDTTTLKIPNTSQSSFCTAAPFVVRARTVYSGPRAVILEDVAAPFAGQQDAYYQALGQEFDDVMYPIVASNFGDPLAYDTATDDNGKLLMLFSKVVNDREGILGFVTACDFLDSLLVLNPPAGKAVASNQAEIFYAIVPDESGSGLTPGNGTYTVDEWRRVMRSVLIHETKHVAMFAEFFANLADNSTEQSWLEEGMAMHAEEQYARAITGASWKGNTGYGAASQNHLWCEVRPTSCPDRPLVMVSHFGFLYDYLSDIENRSIGGPIFTGDASFYGSAWAFVRWIIDAYAPDESAFLRAVTTATDFAGAQNLEARSGVPFSTLLTQFHYALQYDDVAGITPAAPWQHIASWNIRDVYAGLNADFPTIIQQDFLRDHPLQFGSFAVNVPRLRGATAAHFELSGTQAASQVLGLASINGGMADPSLRMLVFRVQ